MFTECGSACPPTCEDPPQFCTLQCVQGNLCIMHAHSSKPHKGNVLLMKYACTCILLYNTQSAAVAHVPSTTHPFS